MPLTQRTVAGRWMWRSGRHAVYLKGVTPNGPSVNCYQSGCGDLLLSSRFMAMKKLLSIFLFGIFTVAGLRAQVPQLIRFQGRVTTNGAPFEGVGQFKFALVNTNTPTTYWSNDGTSTAGGESTAAVSLPVTQGLCSVLLGDLTLPNMTTVPATVFVNSDVWLRVWFSDGVHGFQRLDPDQRIAAVGYAMMAGLAIQAQTVVDGAITSAKLGSGAVGSLQIASGAVGSDQLGSAFGSLSKVTGGAMVSDGSRIGIHTAVPTDLLQLGDFSVLADQYLSIKTAGGNSYRAGIKFRHFDDTGGFNIEDSEVGGENGLRILRYPFGSPDLAMFIDRLSGHVGIGTAAPATRLDVAGEITCTAVNITSDRNAKKHFRPVDSREVLAKVARLPITEWHYKQADTVRHMGPMAQDFREAFALGHDEKHIATVDADGVALAAIQGLNQKLEEQVLQQDTRIRALEKSVDELTALVNKLASQLPGGAR